jgi:hypothetical protein
MDKNNSLKLESLKNDYSLAIVEYDNAYKDFMTLVNQSGVSLKQINNSQLIGKAYKSTTGTNDMLTTCLTMCDSDKTKCSGLDYSQENDLNKCIFFTGNIAIKKNDNHISYIKNINSVYLVLLQTNSRLNNIVSEINDLLDKIQPETKEEIENKEEEIIKLNAEYKLLQAKNEEIKELTTKNENLTNEYNITSIMINKSGFTYFLWVLLLVIILICIIKYVFYS